MSEEKKEKKKRIQVPAYFTSTCCYEAIRMSGKDLFLTFNGNRFETVEILDIAENEEAHPIQYSEEPYIFQDLPKEAKSLPDLYQRLYEVWHNYFVHPDQRVVEFLTLFDLYSYMAVKGPGCIQIFLIGRGRTGKSTAQMIAEKTGYRTFSGVNPSEAAIYRTLGWEVEYAPLIILREYEKASEEMKQVAREADVPGATVPRADKDDEGFSVHHYFVYGPRLCGANKLPSLTDADLDRIHVIKTVKARPLKPKTALYRKWEVKQTLRELRNDLLAWRVASYGSIEFPLEDPLNEFDGRDWEHYGGIITIASMISSDIENRMRQYVRETLGEKAEDSKNSLENVVAQAIIELSIEEKYKTLIGEVEIPFKDIWERLKAICTPYYERGVEVPTKLIAPDGRVGSIHIVGKLISEQLYGKRRTWRNPEDGKVVKGYVWRSPELALIRRLFDNVTVVTDVTVLGQKDKPISDDNQNNETINETNRDLGANTPSYLSKNGNNGNNGNNEPSQSEPQLHQEEAQYSPFHRTETDLGVKPEPKPETKSVISVRCVMNDRSMFYMMKPK